MKKDVKWIGVLAAAGAAIGFAAVYFFKKRADKRDGEDSEFTEDEDFDLDADLQPAEREYVSLHKSNGDQAPESGDQADEDQADDGQDQASEETEETPDSTE